MKLGVLMLTLLPIVAQTGCAGTLQQLMNPPITSDHLDRKSDRSKLKTVSGDRRLVRVSSLKDKDERSPLEHPFMICAETQADAISARRAKSEIEATFKESQKGALTEETAEALTQTYQRTELSDVVRQLSWQLCNARMNGDLDREEYSKDLETLVAGALKVLEVRPAREGSGTDNKKPGADNTKAKGASGDSSESTGKTSNQP